MRASPSDDIAHIKARLLVLWLQLVECLCAGYPIRCCNGRKRVGRNGSIEITPDGLFFDFEKGVGGDLLTFIQHMLKTDFKGAVAFARNFVGSSQRPSITPATNFKRQDDEQRAARQRDKALAMWKRSIPIEGTIAEHYLRRQRCISLEVLPSDLRLVEHCYNHTAAGYYPAMIAAIRNRSGEIMAAHCSFLNKATGDKLAGDGVKPRLIFGSCRGGAIRLAEATDRLALCEGIEDGLSVMQCGGWPVWACAGTAGLRAVELPAGIKEVLIAADADDAGKAAANELAVRLVKEGRKVRIAYPPAGHKDFNSALKAEASHAG